MKAKTNSSGRSSSSSAKSSIRTENNAILASALLFPGAGHIILKKRLIGFCLIGIAGLTFLVLAYDAFRITQEITHDIVRSGEIPNVFVLRDMLYDSLLEQDSPPFKVCISVLVGSWLIGIIDTLRFRFTHNRAEKPSR